jgi:hypothetical protein
VSIEVLAHYKLAPGRDGRPFCLPRPHCHACRDSGLVVLNGDDAGRSLLPDYDRLLDGRQLAGSDAPVVCHCAAACGHRGYRSVPGGPLQNERLASPLSLEQILWLSDCRRRESERSEEEVNLARQRIAAGEAASEATPYAICEVRHALEVAARQRSSNGGLQPLRVLLGGVGTGAPAKG